MDLGFAWYVIRKAHISIKNVTNRLFVFSPCSLSVHRKAIINISYRLCINTEWDKERQFANKTPGSLFVADGAQLLADDFLVLSGCRITVNKGARLTMKSGFINHDSIIECHDSIYIGERAAIGERVIIRDSHGHAVLREDFKKIEPIHIGNHVWIGTNCIILPGVNIGDNAIIAAGSVVNRDVPANTMVAGAPARIIRRNINWTS